MENALVIEIRSITAAALTAMSAAERANWGEAEKCFVELGKSVKRVHRQLSFTNDELRGNGECRMHPRDGNCGSPLLLLPRSETQRSIIMIKHILTAIILLGSVGAASAADYYIVRGPDKKCKVVEKRPTEKTVVVIGDRAYVSREEATKQIAVVCKERN